jgi:uncharacterized membrane protein YvbJ
MEYCPNCGRSGTNFCSFCGLKLYSKPEVQAEKALNNKANIWLIILSALIFFAGLIIYLALHHKPESVKYLKAAQISASAYSLIVFLSAFLPIIII